MPHSPQIAAAAARPLGGDLDGDSKEQVALSLGVAAILRTLDQVSRQHEGDITSALVFAAVLQAAPPGTQAASTPACGGQTHPRMVTVAGLAAQLGIPNETVRRKVNGLIAQGLLTRSDEGLSVSLAYLRSDRMRETRRAGLQILRDLQGQLAQIGLAPLEARAGS